MKTLTILDATQITNKPGGGQSWQGCLGGCTKLTMLKVNTTDRDDIDTTGVAMIHVEIGKDANARTKEERVHALSLIRGIIRLANQKRKSWRKAWYCPRALRSPFVANDTKAIAEWDAENAAMADLLFPGEGLDAVFVDLYEHESTIAGRVKRFTYAVKQWTSRKVKVIPIVCLRMQDSGRILTLVEARELFALAFSLSSTGEVAVFDIMPDGTPDDYRTSPVVRIVEAIASEGITQ